MRVEELIARLERIPRGTLVFLSSDEEGNSVQGIGEIEHQPGDCVVTIFPNGVDA